MIRSKETFEQFSIANYLVKWLFYASPMALIVGSVVALFLWLLDQATLLRWQNPWLIFLLPLAGLSIFWLYAIWGKKTEAGNNLIIDEIHEPDGGVPARIAPLVLITTLITHLFGGSAGREGTAVQMGGGIAGFLGRWMRLNKADLQILLMAGIAAGFSSVFGTPVAGTIFAMEVIAIGTIRYDALLPCLIASVIAHFTCIGWSIQHTHYLIQYTQSPGPGWLPTNLLLLVKIIAAGILFGLVAYSFASLQTNIKTLAHKYISYQWLIPVIGGLMIIALVLVLNTRDYLGLGIVAQHADGASILAAFQTNGVSHWSWFWKLLFTAITLGFGFKGGEVTPLFFIGAAIGNSFAWATGAPVDLFAALGFIAVFAGATNTPLASTIMGVELFGGEHVLYYAIACFLAYYFSGHTGIYHAQRTKISKTHFKKHHE